MTVIILRRGDQVRRLEVPHCPMFDFDDANRHVPAFREALADGWKVAGHIDGVPERSAA